MLVFVSCILYIRFDFGSSFFGRIFRVVLGVCCFFGVVVSWFFRLAFTGGWFRVGFGSRFACAFFGVFFPVFAFLFVVSFCGLVGFWFAGLFGLLAFLPCCPFSLLF